MKKHCFTLIELLTVVAIIAILAGILMPALGAIKNSGMKTQAATEASGIRTAIHSFYNDYKYLPAKATGDIAIGGDVTAGEETNHDFDLAEGGDLGAPYKELFDILCCSNLKGGSNTGTISTDAAKFNPNKKKYLTPVTAYYDATNGGYRDPWGCSYVIYLDTDYNQKIEGMNDKFDLPDDTLNDIVGVYSRARNSETKISKISLNDAVTSW